MAAPTGYPSWVYNSTQLASLIVQTVAQFNALSGAGLWTTTPFASPPGSVPTDPGFINTDTRLQQLLIESRIANLLLYSGMNSIDELTALRAEVLALDSGLTT